MQTHLPLRLSATVLALLLGACTGGQDADGAQASAADLVHVHGLAEDPAGDGIFVATHTGLFQVEGETIRRVGEQFHDLMGFTVAGPEDYLASGHPDLRSEELQAPGKPPLLGLVESADGTEWEPVSLLGEVDFHSLEAAHDRVYGADSTSGRFLVSDDRVTWEAMAEMPLVDFAVSPDDPDAIIGSAQAGVVRTVDGGATWRPLDAPPLVFLDWSASGAFGVAVEGQVSTSTDGGDTWRALGTVGGQPEAILATEERLLVAVADRGILQSTDGGERFELLVATGSSGSSP